MVRVCLNCGANPKIAKKHGLNILMTASQNRHLEIVKHLILCGADVNADSNGLTALMWAARFEYSEIVKHLVLQGANINTRIQRWHNCPHKKCGKWKIRDGKMFGIARCRYKYERYGRTHCFKLGIGAQLSKDSELFKG